MICCALRYYRPLLMATALLALSLPQAAQADDICRLTKKGDCCTVTISPNTPAQIETSIVSTQLVAYIVIRNTQASMCNFTFDGEMKVPMRVRQTGFAGTWIGGKTTLKYDGDEAKLGSCRLALFHMSIDDNGTNPLPATCEKPKT